jgi:3-phenylpropionate/trans-cinnamate dioxygenase ferredoxin component
MVKRECGDTTARSPLAAGSRLVIESASGPIAIFGVGDTAHAIEDGCLRCGSTLATGALDGTVVTCRVCGWAYDLRSGCLVGLPALRVASYRIGAYASPPIGTG